MSDKAEEQQLNYEESSMFDTNICEEFDLKRNTICSILVNVV